MRASLIRSVLAGLAASCGPPSGACELDADCAGGEVCARTSECLPADAVRRLRITWTIDGQPASAATCARSPELYLVFYGFSASEQFGYQPVPCEVGVFTIDKLPTRFTSVELGVVNGASSETVIRASDTVAFDLVP